MKAAPPQTVIIGIKGTVLALDRGAGAEVWRTELTGTDFVNVSAESECVLATTRGEIFCLDRLSGQILWHNPLTGLGRGLITMATEGRNLNAAVLAERRRQEEQQTASAAASAASTI
jgi:outer membrane protein assembly factor BamB